jgi:hypothetical protein
VSVRKRLERLEERTRSQESAEDPYHARLWERYFHAFENGRRELQGLDPLPDLSYTEEDREDDRRCLAEVIPSYRASSPGWQSGEGKAFLDAWEQHIREKLLLRE